MNWEKQKARIAEVGKVFAGNVAEHQVTILHEDGLYRHVRFSQPGTGMYHFDLITWPGYLTIAGDLDSLTFRRLDDMFEFFRAKSGWNLGTINPQYWAEKLVSGREGTEKYDEDLFAEYVTEDYLDAAQNMLAPAGLAVAIRDELGVSVRPGLIDGDELPYDESEARALLQKFEFKGFSFEPWEWSLTTWSWHYLYACHAIQWGIARYDEAKAAVRESAEAGR